MLPEQAFLCGPLWVLEEHSLQDYLLISYSQGFLMARFTTATASA